MKRHRSQGLPPAGLNTAGQGGVSKCADENSLVEEALKELAAEGRISIQTDANGEVRYSSAGVEGHDGESTEGSARIA